MSSLIDALSSAVPTELTEHITLGRTLTRRAADVASPGLAPANGPTEAINGRLEHLRGSALSFRNLTPHRQTAARGRQFQALATPSIVKSR